MFWIPASRRVTSIRYRCYASIALTLSLPAAALGECLVHLDALAALRHRPLAVHRPNIVGRAASRPRLPGSYGFLDLVTSEDGTGIRGGVGGGPGYESHAIFYVGVPDVEAALQRAEELGGTRVWVRPPHRSALSSVTGSEIPT